MKEWPIAMLETEPHKISRIVPTLLASIALGISVSFLIPVTHAETTVDPSVPHTPTPQTIKCHYKKKKKGSRNLGFKCRWCF